MQDQPVDPVVYAREAFDRYSEARLSLGYRSQAILARDDYRFQKMANHAFRSIRRFLERRPWYIYSIAEARSMVAFCWCLLVGLGGFIVARLFGNGILTSFVWYAAFSTVAFGAVKIACFLRRRAYMEFAMGIRYIHTLAGHLKQMRPMVVGKEGKLASLVKEYLDDLAAKADVGGRDEELDLSCAVNSANYFGLAEWDCGPLVARARAKRIQRELAVARAG